MAGTGNSAPETDEALSDHELVHLLRDGVLDAELAALLATLARAGVPLVVASRHAPDAERVHGALLDAHRGGGVLLADSLDEVVRLAGGRGAGELPDELRELGLLVVVRRLEYGPRVVAAHYVRPLERDAGGHVQRRGPAVLATLDATGAAWEHFAWAISSELAERAGIDPADFEHQLAARRARLALAAG